MSNPLKNCLDLFGTAVHPRRCRQMFDKIFENHLFWLEERLWLWFMPAIQGEKKVSPRKKETKLLCIVSSQRKPLLFSHPNTWHFLAGIFLSSYQQLSRKNKRWSCSRLKEISKQSEKKLNKFSAFLTFFSAHGSLQKSTEIIKICFWTSTFSLSKWKFYLIWYKRIHVKIGVKNLAQQQRRKALSAMARNLASGTFTNYGLFKLCFQTGKLSQLSFSRMIHIFLLKRWQYNSSFL